MSCNDDPYPKCGRSPSMQTTCAGSSLECGSFSTPPSRSPGPILGTPRHHSSTLNLPSSRLTWRWLALLGRRLLYGNASPHYLRCVDLPGGVGWELHRCALDRSARGPRRDSSPSRRRANCCSSLIGMTLPLAGTVLRTDRTEAGNAASVDI